MARQRRSLFCVRERDGLNLNTKLNALGVCALSLLSLPLIWSPRPASEPAIVESYRLPISAPRDQGSSDLCWIFATLSLLETNYRVRHPGSMVEFSRGAVQRQAIVDRFRRAISGEKPYWADGGLAVEALALIRENGLVAQPDYHDFVDSAPIYANVSLKLAQLDDSAAKREAVEAALAPAPELTHLEGAAETPRALAQSVLGDSAWVEYDVAPDGGERVGPSKDPDARPDTLVHYAPLAKLVDLIHASLKRGEAVVWGNVDHAMLIYGADYSADGRAVAYWVKDSAPARAERMTADEVHGQLTDVTVSLPKAETLRTATD